MIQYGIVNYIFGSPGSGKTTVLAMIARWYRKKYKGIRIYTNFPLKDCVMIDDDALGYYSFENSVLLLDELGISYNNRDAFSKRGLMSDPNRLQYWKLIRHYLQRPGGFKGACYIASQSWSDVDKKLRDLCTDYFLIKKSIIPWFTTIKKIYKKVDIDENTHEPCDFYVMDMFFHWKYCFRPLYYKYFDSYDAPNLPDYGYEVTNTLTNSGKNFLKICQTKIKGVIEKYVSKKQKEQDDTTLE